MKLDDNIKLMNEYNTFFEKHKEYIKMKECLFTHDCVICSNFPLIKYNNKCCAIDPHVLRCELCKRNKHSFNSKKHPEYKDWFNKNE